MWIVVGLQVFLAVAQAIITFADVRGDAEGDVQDEQNRGLFSKLRNYIHPRDQNGRRLPRRTIVTYLIALTPLATLAVLCCTMYVDACTDQAERDETEKRHASAMQDAKERHDELMLRIAKNNDELLHFVAVLRTKAEETGVGVDVLLEKFDKQQKINSLQQAAVQPPRVEKLLHQPIQRTRNSAAPIQQPSVEKSPVQLPPRFR
jgi:hypothetical protein